MLGIIASNPVFNPTCWLKTIRSGTCL